MRAHAAGRHVLVGLTAGRGAWLTVWRGGGGVWAGLRPARWSATTGASVEWRRPTSREQVARPRPLT